MQGQRGVSVYLCVVAQEFMIVLKTAVLMPDEHLPMDGQREPKVPKGAQSRAKGNPRAPQREPKGPQSRPGGTNYIKKLPINRTSGRYVNYVSNIRSLSFVHLALFT